MSNKHSSNLEEATKLLKESLSKSPPSWQEINAQEEEGKARDEWGREQMGIKKDNTPTPPTDNTPTGSNLENAVGGNRALLENELRRALDDATAHDKRVRQANDALFGLVPNVQNRITAYNEASEANWNDSEQAVLQQLLGDNGLQQPTSNSARLQTILNQLVRNDERAAMAAGATANAVPSARYSPYNPNASSPEESKAQLSSYLKPGTINTPLKLEGYRDEASSLDGMALRTLRSIGASMARASKGELSAESAKNSFDRAAIGYLKSVSNRGASAPGLESIIDDKDLKSGGFFRYIEGYKDKEGNVITEPIDVLSDPVVRGRIVGDIKNILLRSPMFANPNNRGKIASLLQDTMLSGSGGEKGMKSQPIDLQSALDNVVTALAETIMLQNMKQGYASIPLYVSAGHTPIRGREGKAEKPKKGAREMLEELKKGTLPTKVQ